jgi:hypothetical protein
MKNNFLLIYDDQCPFCSWYSRQFVQFNLLPADGTTAFSTLAAETLQKIDFDRARNEIPLVDRQDNKVYYGVDALLAILGQRFPHISSLVKRRPLYFIFKKLYCLTSYNRKVIVAKPCGSGRINCAPVMNYPYRFLFLLLTLCFNTLLLFPLNKLIFSPLAGHVISGAQIQCIHFTIVAWNCFLAIGLSRFKATEYIGQINMLALLTIVMLMPLLLLCVFFTIPLFITITYLAIVTVFVFREYLRRMDYAGIINHHRWIAAINLATITALLLLIFI